jgi:hypothetical protein
LTLSAGDSKIDSRSSSSSISFAFAQGFEAVNKLLIKYLNTEEREQQSYGQGVVKARVGCKFCAIYIWDGRWCGWKV